MTSTAAMAAALANLTEALDDTDLDIAHSLRLLSLATAAAVPSYRGLSVVVPQSDPPLMFTMLIDGAVAADIGTSLRLQWQGRRTVPRSSTVAIVLYAAAPGAFVDLAADVVWLTALPSRDIVLDEHFGLPAKPGFNGSLAAASAINQAIGVLIGRGYTPQQAGWHLDVQAAHHRTDRHSAARLILSKIETGSDDEHFHMP
jgi:hypothetical protein